MAEKNNNNKVSDERPCVVGEWKGRIVESTYQTNINGLIIQGEHALKKDARLCIGQTFVFFFLCFVFHG